MLALPSAPAPERRHSLLVGTAFAVAAGAAAFAGLLGTYLVARERELDALREAGETVRFLPEGVVMPGIPSNIMLFIFVGASIMAQWAVYAIRRPSGDQAGSWSDTGPSVRRLATPVSTSTSQRWTIRS